MQPFTKKRYAFEYQLNRNGEIISSDPQFAYSETMVKQLAAQSLLNKITKIVMPENCMTLSTDEEQELKLENPKGQLLEFCSANQLRKPKFKTEAVPNGFTGSAFLTLYDQSCIESGIYFAPNQKSVDHAACKELLAKIKHYLQNPEAAVITCTDYPSVPVSHKKQVVDRRNDLNQMKQMGVLLDFGYELLERKGTPHEPVFTMQGWFEVPDSPKRVTGQVTAGSKKECQKLCADLIFEMFCEG